MPPQQSERTKALWARAFDLPPPFRLITLREAGDAFGHACAHASELGAGTLVLVGRFDLVEFAVVLEPEEPLAATRRVFIAGMGALVNALSAVAPPRRPIAIEWPGTLLVDGGLVGGGRLGWAPGTRETTVPEWLVFGAMIRSFSMMGSEGGQHPLATALEDEGFDMAGSDRVVEGFARHFMGAIDHWHGTGFGSIAADYVSKLSPLAEARYALDDQGDLLIQRRARPVERRSLRSALETVTWFDPENGAPRT